MISHIELSEFSYKSSGAIYLLQTHVDVNQYSRRWKAYHSSSAAYRNLPAKINIMARAYKSRARKKTVIAKKEKSVLYFCAHINVFHSVYGLEKCQFYFTLISLFIDNNDQKIYSHYVTEDIVIFYKKSK